MVYTGQPSKGCENCRKRHIKCDEKMPACGNCLRVKKECPGYKNHFDIAWRDQTTVAKKGVERGKAKRMAAREREREREKEQARGAGNGSSRESGNLAVSIHALVPQYADSSGHASSNLESPPLLAKQYPPAPPDPYITIIRPIPEEQALCFFFNNYVLPIRDPFARKGFLEYLGPIYANADPLSPVKMSTMAVATCMMSSRMGETGDTPLSQSFYLAAVSTIKDLVATQKDCTNDELIAAVLLLQLYEASTGFLIKRASDPHPHPHLNGALALIRHRGHWNFKKEVSRSFLLHVRGLLIDAAFRTNSRVPRDVESWTILIPETDQLPSFRFDTINLKLANLRISVSAIINSPMAGSTFPQVHQFIREAVEIGGEFLDWSKSLPDSWVPVRVTKEHNIPPTLQLYQDYCDVYQSLFLSNTWNKLRLSQIEVQSIIVSCLRLKPATPTLLTQQKLYEDSMQQLADDICASVPYFLGDRMKPGRTGDPGVNYPRAPGRPPVIDHYQTGPALGGWFLLRPLGALMKMNIKLRDGQRGWLAGQMARTVRIYNIAEMPKS